MWVLHVCLFNLSPLFDKVLSRVRSHVRLLYHFLYPICHTIAPKTIQIEYVL